MERCKFNIAWQGQCHHNANKSGYCNEHKDIMCVNCGEKATKECSQVFSLVCGSPICDNCGHYDEENPYRHVKKK